MTTKNICTPGYRPHLLGAIKPQPDSFRVRLCHCRTGSATMNGGQFSLTPTQKSTEAEGAPRTKTHESRSLPCRNPSLSQPFLSHWSPHVPKRRLRPSIPTLSRPSRYSQAKSASNRGRDWPTAPVPTPGAATYAGGAAC